MPDTTETDLIIQPNVSALLLLAEAETGRPACCLRYDMTWNDRPMIVEVAVRACPTPGRFTIHLGASGRYRDNLMDLYFPDLVRYLKSNLGQGWRVQEGDEAKVGRLPGEIYFSVERQPA